MTLPSAAHDLFFVQAGLDLNNLTSIVGDALAKADDGELFLEYRQSEGISLDDGRIKSASFDTAQGFGLRSVAADAIGYAHGSTLSAEAIRRAATTVKAVSANHSGIIAQSPILTNQRLYTDLNPLALTPFADKIDLLQQIDAYARSRDPGSTG